MFAELMANLQLRTWRRLRSAANTDLIVQIFERQNDEKRKWSFALKLISLKQSKHRASHSGLISKKETNNCQINKRPKENIESPVS